MMPLIHYTNILPGPPSRAIVTIVPGIKGRGGGREPRPATHRVLGGTRIASCARNCSEREKVQARFREGTALVPKTASDVVPILVFLSQVIGCSEGLTGLMKGVATLYLAF